MFMEMSYGVYFFFASLMILSVPFVYLLIPETKGVPLEKMDELFDIKPTAKAHGIMLERLKEQESLREVFVEKVKDEDWREGV